MVCTIRSAPVGSERSWVRAADLCRGSFGFRNLPEKPGFLQTSLTFSIRPRILYGDIMAVRRIVANIAADRLDAARAFYGDLLGMSIVMDLGWMTTLAADGSMTPQFSVATEGGSGTQCPTSQ